jgi:hypothetical protein
MCFIATHTELISNLQQVCSHFPSDTYELLQYWGQSIKQFALYESKFAANYM